MSFRCPKCGCGDLLDENFRPVGTVTAKKTDKGNFVLSDRPWKVIKTKDLPNIIIRKRRCRNCGRIIKTKETVIIED